MRKEADVKRKIRECCKRFGIYFVTPMGTGYGRSGVPDILICAAGQFIAVECKFGGNKPTALQAKELQDIARSGGETWVVDETNVQEFCNWLERVAV